MRAIRIVLTLGLIGWWSFLLLMTHLPKPPPIGPHVGDKPAHMMAYGTLGALLWLNFRSRGRSASLAAALTVGTVLFAGALDEWTQPFFGRSCELLDWCADVSGAAIASHGLALAEWLLRRLTRTQAT